MLLTLLKFFYIKFKTISLRLKLVYMVKKSKTISLSINRLLWIIRNPTEVEPFITFSYFIKNKKMIYIDVGANDGKYCFNFMTFYSKYFDEIYLIEPLKELNASIKKNVPYFTEIINNLIIDKKKQTNFHKSSNSSLSSIFEYSNNTNKIYENKNKGIIQVMGQTLDNIVKNKNQKSIFLKIDTQGSELLALKGAKKLLNNVDLLYIECSFASQYKNNEPTFSKIVAFLDKYNLIPVCFETYSEQISFSAFERNILFVKKDNANNIFN